MFVVVLLKKLKCGGNPNIYGQTKRKVNYDTYT